MGYIPEGRRGYVMKGTYERSLDWPEPIPHDDNFRNCRLCHHGYRMDGIYWCDRCGDALANLRSAREYGFPDLGAFMHIVDRVAWSRNDREIPVVRRGDNHYLIQDDGKWVSIDSTEYLRLSAEVGPEPEPPDHHYWRCKEEWNRLQMAMYGSIA